MRVGDQLDVQTGENGDLVEVQKASREGGVEREREKERVVLQLARVEEERLRCHFMQRDQRRVRVDVLAVGGRAFWQDRREVRQLPLQLLLLLHHRRIADQPSVASTAPRSAAPGSLSAHLLRVRCSCARPFPPSSPAPATTLNRLSCLPPDANTPSVAAPAVVSPSSLHSVKRPIHAAIPPSW